MKNYRVKKYIQKIAVGWLILVFAMQPVWAFAAEPPSPPPAPEAPSAPPAPEDPPPAPEEPAPPPEAPAAPELTDGGDAGSAANNNSETGTLSAGSAAATGSANSSGESAGGSGAGTSAQNSNTGAGSNNSSQQGAGASSTTAINNSAQDASSQQVAGNTGGNGATGNTGNGSVNTGGAGVGITQVKNDNTAVVGGRAGLTTSGQAGDVNGDITLGFGAGSADLTDGSSVRAVNSQTGESSDNSTGVSTTTENVTEVQNDGTIDNSVDASATTGNNTADMNTGSGIITTGDANVSATLVNLLNSTVINGDLWVTVADIFGNLNGNINIPALWGFLSPEAQAALLVEASNSNTGPNSNNTIDVEINDTEQTNVDNKAEVATNVDAEAITGQNEASMNTGGSSVKTGDASVSASNITVANTTVEGGTWGLFIVNALNNWLGFLVGDDGSVRALTQQETVDQIQAANENTGPKSDNEVAVQADRTETTNIDNDATINNNVTASAITGQNGASMNTGVGQIETGDASVEVTAINIANTTVKDGSLFIAVVNIFGDWFGDLFYNGGSLAQTASQQASGAGGTAVTAGNTNTGANSDNTTNVDVNREQETNIDNQAEVTTNINATVDTGNNQTDKNTGAGQIETGDGLLALHTRTLANLVGVAGDGGIRVEVNGTNDTTGLDSTNTIRVDINDDRVVAVNNDADVSTVIQGAANTGDNQSSMNTLGGTIQTGIADARVGVTNLVNQVLALLGGGDQNIEATFVNRLTGADSDNDNSLIARLNRLLKAVNDATVRTLVDLFLNTGGNLVWANTGGAGISTGPVCVNLGAQNKVNQTSSSGGSALIQNNADVATLFNVFGQTGGNSLLDNTGGAGLNDPPPCDPVQPTPTPMPTSTPGPSPTPDTTDDDGGSTPPSGGGTTDSPGNGQGGNGDGQQEVAAVEDRRDPRIAGILTRAPLVAGGGPILQRFPVAGAESMARWLQGERQGIWFWYTIAALMMISFAFYLDNRAINSKTAVAI